jgi:hypothetical protein
LPRKTNENQRQRKKKELKYRELATQGSTHSKTALRG